MSRFARVVVPEFPHHVTQRGNAKRDVFYTTADRLVYLRLLRRYAEFYSLRVLGYCVMTNHVHLVVIPGFEESLAKAMREVHGRYAQYRNAIEQQSGHVWQNRFYSCPFEPIRLANVLRYVELNPVRAGLTQAAEDYAWSSAVMHLGGPDPIGLLDLEEWKRGWSPAEWADVLGSGPEDSRAIRQATFGGRPLGSELFVAGLEKKLDRKLAKSRPGRKPEKTQSLAAG